MKNQKMNRFGNIMVCCLLVVTWGCSSSLNENEAERMIIEQQLLPRNEYFKLTTARNLKAIQKEGLEIALDEREGLLTDVIGRFAHPSERHIITFTKKGIPYVADQRRNIVILGKVHFKEILDIINYEKENKATVEYTIEFDSVTPFGKNRGYSKGSLFNRIAKFKYQSVKENWHIVD